MHFFHSAFIGSPDKCLAPILSWHIARWPALPCALLFVALALSTKANIAIMIAVATCMRNIVSLHRQKHLFNNAAIEPMWNTGRLRRVFVFGESTSFPTPLGERPAGLAQGD